MRIRSIKPEFWLSESIGRLSREARLLFIGLWSFADDSGRARASSRILASALFAYDQDAISTIDGWIEELRREGMIRTYLVDGNSYLDIPKWLSHQKIDKPSQSKLPPFAEDSRGFAEDSRGFVVGTGNREQGVGSREQGEGEEARPSVSPAKVPSQKLADLSRTVLGLTPEPALLLLLEAFPEDWIRRALMVCVGREVKGLPYLRTILQRWKKDGRPDDDQTSSHSRNTKQPLSGPAAREAGKFDGWDR